MEIISSVEHATSWEIDEIRLEEIQVDSSLACMATATRMDVLVAVSPFICLAERLEISTFIFTPDPVTSFEDVVAELAIVAPSVATLLAIFFLTIS